MIIEPLDLQQLVQLSGIVGTILYTPNGTGGFTFVVPGWNIVYDGTQEELATLLASGTDLRQVNSIDLEGTPTPP